MTKKIIARRAPLISLNLIAQRPNEEWHISISQIQTPKGRSSLGRSPDMKDETRNSLREIAADS